MNTFIFHPKTWRWTSTVLASLTALAVPLHVAAQKPQNDYPSQPISLIVAFSAGGAADVVTRAMAPKLASVLGVSVIVENRAGANGNIGANYVAKSKPDGYTLLIGFPGLTTNPSLYKQMSYDPEKDLVPIKMLATAPVLLVAKPNLAANTVPELIALAKSKPGTLNYGSAGVGASGHMAAELFKMTAHVQMQHIPYKGGALALTDLMGGQIDLLFDSVASSRPLVEGKKIKALAIAGKQRSPALPNVPTFAEAGLPDYYAGTWFGLLAPKGIPQEVRERLAAAAAKVIKDPGVQASFDKLGIIADEGSSEDFASFMKDETAKWANVVKTADIRLE